MRVRSFFPIAVRKPLATLHLRYIPVFDVARDGFAAWWFSGVGIAFIAIGTGVLIYVRKQTGPKARLRKMFMMVWTGAAVLWTISAYSVTRAEYVRLRDALATHRGLLVEGVVTHFKPEPSGGHANEEFDVGERHYSFSDYVVISGYHRSKSHGGAIREGLHVRITDINGQIGRLDTAADIAAPLPNDR